VIGAVKFVVSFGLPPLDLVGVQLPGEVTVNPVQSVVTVAVGAALLVPGIHSLSAARRANSTLGTILLIGGRQRS
jgi:hypothetical protein